MDKGEEGCPGPTQGYLTANTLISQSPLFLSFITVMACHCLYRTQPNPLGLSENLIL